MRFRIGTAEWVNGLVRSFVDNSRNNRLKQFPQQAIYEEPLVGFAPGGDPLFQQLKCVIGPFHMTPSEAFHVATGLETPDEELTVIVWVLPFAKQIVASNAEQIDFPSEQWVHSRLDGEQFNDDVRQHLVGRLHEAGIQAAAPAVSSGFRVLHDFRVGYASSWSERHAAYVAGLGSFGLSDGFITARGVAMRCGSVIARAQIGPQTVRRPGPHEYCEFYAGGSCMACADRCPAGAISELGHDKDRCAAFIASCEDRARQIYGVQNYGCALCQCGVPCATGVPALFAQSHY